MQLLVIFDNVDHYVDLQSGMLAGAPGRFVERVLQSGSQVRLVFTCRPKISHPNLEVMSMRLDGLRLEDVSKLFELRGANLDKPKIAKVHKHTAGHAFWVDLIAAQVARHKIDADKLEYLLSSIAEENVGIPDKTLNSIWDGLLDREQIVLQALAEAMRPTSALELSEYISSKLRYNQMSKALSTLRDLNLVVVKPQEGEHEGFELHPLIRTFIRQTFPRNTRKGFIDAIFAVYSAFFGSHREELTRHPSRGVLLHWLEGAELCINAGQFDQACEVLSEVSQLFNSTEPPGEFVRVVEILFKAASIAECKKFKSFETVFRCYIRLVSNLGRTDIASEALREYFDTLEGKEARYIQYCDMMAHLHWTNGNYPAAIKWGTEGTKLKAESGVDTNFSSDHTLALAQRDSGAIDPALKFFLRGTALEKVVEPDVVDVGRGGEYYGNIGRCLHLMGQVEPALICYRKSARLIEGTSGHIENQAYVRQWIGELLLTKAETETARCFLTAAVEKWNYVSPPRVDRLNLFISQTFPDDNHLHALEAEEYCLKWITSQHPPSLELFMAS